MRATFFLVLLVGMALAGAAVYMIRDYVSQTEIALENERAFNQKAGNLVEVFVFAKDLKYGDELKEGDVTVIYWPEQALPKTIFRDKAQLFPENSPGPRYVMRAIEAFEPVLASRVTEPGELASLTAKLGKGMRAFVIRGNIATGVGGFVKPDDFIDIYWSGDIEGDLVTRLIASSVQVIAVDQAFNEGQVTDSAVTTVTIGVTPEQVASLTQMQKLGDLSMSLVGATADVVTESIEVDTNEALGIIEKAPEVVAPVVVQDVCTRRERKGTEVIESVVPCDQ